MTADASEGDGRGQVVRTGRWRGVQALAFVATALGILLGAPLVVLTGLVGVGFAAYSRAWDAPAPELSVTRSVDETAPEPGDRVRVTLSVTNESDRLLPDVRLCDGVPEGLRVVDGTPRHTTALRPGKSVTVAYEVEAVRGSHAFDEVTVVTRDLSGSERRTMALATTPTTVTCRPAYDQASVGLGDLATLLTGSLPVSETGSGIAFHSLREYRRGDPMGRLDWSHLAKRGELATRRFDEPRTVRVVLLVDARAQAYVTADAEQRRPAVDVCAHAAGALAAGLPDDGVRVGLAALSPESCWVPTGSGTAHRERLLDTVTTHPAFDWSPPVERGDSSLAAGQSVAAGPESGADESRSGQASDGGADDIDAGDDVSPPGQGAPPEAAVASDGSGTAPEDVTEVARDRARTLLDDVASRFPGTAQVVFCTPLVDDVAAATAARLDAQGYDVSVASPDVTRTDAPARRLAGVERDLRLDALRRRGIPVHDWTPPTDPTADAGWSACR